MEKPFQVTYDSAPSNNFLDQLWVHPALHPLSPLSRVETPRRTISNHFAQNSTLFVVGKGDLEIK